MLCGACGINHLYHKTTVQPHYEDQVCVSEDDRQSLDLHGLDCHSAIRPGSFPTSNTLDGASAKLRASLAAVARASERSSNDAHLHRIFVASTSPPCCCYVTDRRPMTPVSRCASKQRPSAGTCSASATHARRICVI